MEKTRVFCDSKTHHGGARTLAKHAGGGKHITLVIAASASGIVYRPFFIVAGVKVMENWFSPLDVTQLSSQLPTFLRDLCEEGWFPKRGTVFCTQRKSMDSRTLKLFIQHLHRTVRTNISEREQFILTLDNHGSRKGLE